jgi:GPI mannosyltransferase 3
LLAFIRPTSIVTWLPLCFHHIRKSKYPVWELLVKRYLFIGLLVGGVLTALDSFFHGSFILTPYEFVKANVFEGVGSFYGTHPIYWYINTGLPAVLGIGLIPFLLSIFSAISSWDNSKTRQILLVSIIFTIFAYSLLPHKEFRFLLQILPLCLYCITQFLSEWSRTKSSMLIWLVAVVILVSNVVPAGYLGFVHQQGTIKVMDKVADVAQNYKTKDGHSAKIFFMMPCHSTPYYSHVHANVTMRFLSCEPNFKNQENYVDEADKFYEAPMKWIRTHLPVHPISALPTHVVTFDTLAPKISDFLSIYKPIETFFHSDHLLSTKSGNNVILFERIEQVAEKKAENKREEQMAQDKVQDEL